MYGNLKNLVSVFLSVLFSSGLLSSFKFRYLFVNKFSWKLVLVQNFYQVSKTYPCVVDFVNQSKKVLMRPFLYLEGVKLKKLVSKPVHVGFLQTDVTRLGLLHTKTSKKGSLPFFQFPC